MRILASTLGDLMYQGWLNPSIGIGDVEVIVPVPLHPSRERERGYNQASLLALHMGACLGIPVDDGLLERSKPTRPQVGLSGLERRKNVRDAFRCVDTALAGKKILLIDDVCTSSSTLEAACRTLRDVGASSVWAYTLARARRSATIV
ncbi:ComF family protein [Chloroflexota bacterium]